MDDFWTVGESLDEVQIQSGTATVADAALQRLADPPGDLTDVYESVGEYYAEMPND